MSKNILLNGTTYNDIKVVTLPLADGSGLAEFQDVDENSSGGGSDEKILYMDAELLNAGGPYPVDADDYTTAVIPAEATFIDVEAFENLLNIDTLIINGDCEFEVVQEPDSYGKSYTYYNTLTKNYIPIRKLIVQNRTTQVPEYFMRGVGTLVEATVSGGLSLQAFNGCSYLRKVLLENCEHIGANSFYSCTNLRELTILGTLSSYDGSIFGAVPSDLVIRGAAGSQAETLAREYGITFEAIAE